MDLANPEPPRAAQISLVDEPYRSCQRAHIGGPCGLNGIETGWRRLVPFSSIRRRNSAALAALCSASAAGRGRSPVLRPQVSEILQPAMILIVAVAALLDDAFRRQLGAVLPRQQVIMLGNTPTKLWLEITRPDRPGRVLKKSAGVRNRKTADTARRSAPG